MDKSILLQKQIRDNSEDLQKELRDMEAWEEQMKKEDLEMRFLKEDKVIPPIRTKIKKKADPNADVSQGEKPSKTKRIEGSDYKSWDSFDADKACKEIEKNDKSNEKVEKVLEIPSKEQLEKEHAEATKLKDEGNALVQKQQYASAVSKYNEAIKIFPHDAAFYANRALCQLKSDNLYSAESDCTAAIKLDETYVKAYHRRASARIELKRYKDAAEDIETVLKLEPSNKEAASMLKQVKTKIEKSPKPLIISGDEKPEKSSIEKQIGKKVNKIFSDQELEKDHVEATKYKDEGNALVQKQEYASAVEKYSQAIKIFPYDAAYFANRALCRLKLDKFHDAESDCTFAIELDDMYLKAYLRRATARMEQKNYENALKDVQKVLKIAPSNKEAACMLKQIQAKLEKSSEASSLIDNSVKKEKSAVKENNNCIESNSLEITHTHVDKQDKIPNTVRKPDQTESTNEELPSWLPKLKEGVSIVESLVEPPTRQKQILKRILIKEIPEHESIFKDVVEGENKKKSEGPVTKEEKIVHNDSAPKSQTNSIESYEKDAEKIDNLPPPPKSSVAFLLNWRKNVSPDFRYKYLKQITPKNLPDIFKESMESNIFSEILVILNTKFIDNKDEVYDFLYYLAKLKRFRALILFMTQEDKETLRSLFKCCKTNEGRTDNEVNNLHSAYEM